MNRRTVTRGTMIRVSAGLLICGSAIALLAGVLVVALGATGAPMMLAVGGWGIASSVGIFRRQRWARISMLWLSGVAVLAGASALLAVLVPRPGSTEVSPAAIRFISVFGALLTISGAWWLWLFNSRVAHWYFQSHPTRPLRVSLIVCYLVLDAINNGGSWVMGNPAQIFGWKLTGASATWAYAGGVVLALAFAAAAWLWTERARRYIAVFLGLYAAHHVMVIFTSRHKPGWDYRVINAAIALLPIIGTILATRRWTRNAPVFDTQEDPPAEMVPAGEPPVASGVVTTGELVRFSYFHVNRRSWPCTLTALIVIPAFALAILISPQSIGSPIVQNLAPFVVLLLLWLLLPWWGARRQQRTLQHLRERVAYRLSEAGVHAEGENFRGELGWKLVHAVRETKTMFLIYHSAGVAWVIPKRFLAGDDEVETFGVYLEKHLRDTRRYYAPGVIGSWI